MSRNLRSSQLLTPFGIGQIVNFPNEESLMICGLDQWDKVLEQRREEAGKSQVHENEFTIYEARLQRLLGVEKFKTPWAFKKTGTINTNLSIPAVRFPCWHYCSKCGRMTELNPSQPSMPECSAVRKSTSCGGRLLPVRFVAVCRHGHIEDVPFQKWVHNGVPNEGNHLLTYKARGSSGDLASLVISCSCGSQKSLAGLLNVRKSEGGIFDSALARIGLQGESFSEQEPNHSNVYGHYCSGNRPWLFPNSLNNSSVCNAHLQVLIRGGSNIHYPNVVSAIYLPDGQSDLHPALSEILEGKQKNGQDGKEYFKLLYNQDGTGEILKIVLRVEPALAKFGSTVDEIVQEIKKLWEETPETTESTLQTVIDLRRQEYLFFLDKSKKGDRDLKTQHRNISGFEHSEQLGMFFDDIVLIEKLKETRVFTGFSRIIGLNFAPDSPSSELSNDEITWLPAVEVFGEGIFLNFNRLRLDSWLVENSGRGRELIERYHNAMGRRNPAYLRRELDNTFVMMHTFAHLLIKRLCFNCGYGSSSLREKIYFSNEPNDRMNGILIYTSSGDSEGSMGGLVRQGKEHNLFKLVKDAIEDAKWCSADPVCSEIGKRAGQGPDNTNGSACHNCSIVPETSCEEFNVLLDRATIIGTIDGSYKGYFDFD